MKHYGLDIAEGTDITNLTLPSGTADPTVAPNAGELFYRTDLLAARLYNGSSWSSIGGSGLANIIEDLTPQLGGNLDVNSKLITSVSGGAVTIAPDTNGDANIHASGTGNVSIQTAAASGQITITTLEEMTLTAPTVLVRTGAGSGGQGLIKFEEEGTGGGEYVALTAPSTVLASRTWFLPTDNPTSVNGQFLTTSTTGALSFAIPNVVDDTTPQLGGSLDTNGFNIVGTQVNLIPTTNSSSAITTSGTGNISLTNSGTGTTTITSAISVDFSSPFVSVKATSASLGGSLRVLEGSTNGTNYIELKSPDTITTNRTWGLPQDDPSTANGQFLTTDSSGNLSFATAGSSQAKSYFFSSF